MHTARRSAQAVVAILASGVVSVPTFSQSTRFLNAEVRSVHRLALSSSANTCSGNSVNSLDAVSGDIPAPGSSPSCVPPSLADRSAPVTPCDLAAQSIHPCSTSSDIVRDDLNTTGKRGQIILRARDKVLQILQSDNACSAWYRTKDPDPAATFRTLTFALDRDGDVYVRKGPESQGISIIRNPYVARVLQGAGPQSTVTINVNGAFFFSMASVIDDRFEGGPISFRGSRPIQVGPYRGGSFHAQVLALLHEFGHVIDLLPQDHDDYEGRSRKNTQDVLYVCRAAVESKEAPRTFLASR
ncbi:MAG: hypothetical protein DMG38_25895 [Acidobacteria bacterium]|nr:MAG: hypothetical protein DMG38_25895 [Acidobacteriota bacterium]